MKYIKEKQKAPRRLQESLSFSIKNIRIYKGSKRIVLDLNDLRKVSGELTGKWIIYQYFIILFLKINKGRKMADFKSFPEESQNYILLLLFILYREYLLCNQLCKCKSIAQQMISFKWHSLRIYCVKGSELGSSPMEDKLQHSPWSQRSQRQVNVHNLG